MQDNDLAIFVIFTTLIILVLVLFLSVSLIITWRKRNRQQIEMAETKLRFEQELRKVENEVSEHVMRHFGQELHDNIGQLLTATHIQIENQKIDHPTLSRSFEPIEAYLGDVSQQLRLMSRTLNADYLGHIGLPAAIQLEVERLRALKRFEVKFENTAINNLLEKNQELMIFRIFQEIIQNALRHSGAKLLEISIGAQNRNFELRVSDDGKGFERDSVLISPKASGLRNIMKRAEISGLECTLSSSPGKGTWFVLKKLTV